MTNNQLCDLIGLVGCIISCICMGLCFLGGHAWVGIVIGLVLMGVSQVNYD